jgi:hypothetical protein
MSTAGLCNNLVPSRYVPRSRLLVDFREHYCPDTPADMSVRSQILSPASVMLGSRAADQVTQQHLEQRMRVLLRSPTRQQTNAISRSRGKIENNAQRLGPILRVRRCADKWPPAVRSSSSKGRFESRGTPAARPGRWQHSPELCGHSPPQPP